MRVLNYVAVNASQGYPAMSYLIVTDCGQFFTTYHTPTKQAFVPGDALPSFVRNGAAYDVMQKSIDNQRIIAQGQARGFVVKQFGLIR